MSIGVLFIAGRIGVHRFPGLKAETWETRQTLLMNGSEKAMFRSAPTGLNTGNFSFPGLRFACPGLLSYRPSGADVCAAATRRVNQNARDDSDDGEAPGPGLKATEIRIPSGLKPPAPSG